MSISANEIKKKISATESMAKITKAMQMVSVSKLGKTESRLKHFKEYHAEIKRMVSTLMDSEYMNEHLFCKGYKKPKNNKIGCVVITSNRGLVGGYNNYLFKMLKDGGGYNVELFKMIDAMRATDATFKFYITGQKGIAFAKSELTNDGAEYFLFPDEVQYINVLKLTQRLIADYLSGEVSAVIVVYQDFVSKLEQKATQKRILPIEFESDQRVRMPNYEIFPTEQKAIHEVLMQYLVANLYEIFLNANVSEHAARMNTMNNAMDNAEEIIKESKLIYNRARQAIITQELNEIIAGANAVN